MSLNKVLLTGNVGRDPELRYVAQNQPVATFSLATTERAYTTSAGTQVPERTEWHNIVMWGRQAETAERYIRKGTKLFIEGHLRTRNWEDRNNIRRYVTEIYVDNFEILSRPSTQPTQTTQTNVVSAQPVQPTAAPEQPTATPSAEDATPSATPEQDTDTQALPF